MWIFFLLYVTIDAVVPKLPQAIVIVIEQFDVDSITWGRSCPRPAVLHEFASWYYWWPSHGLRSAEMFPIISQQNQSSTFVQLASLSAPKKFLLFKSVNQSHINVFDKLFLYSMFSLVFSGHFLCQNFPHRPCDVAINFCQPRDIDNVPGYVCSIQTRCNIFFEINRMKMSCQNRTVYSECRLRLRGFFWKRSNNPFWAPFRHSWTPSCIWQSFVQVCNPVARAQAVSY